ncbi:MAG: VOC family protein [Chloroflexi bacterium]|nr:VOC family protein [Chloroflexota bacterium]
MTGSKLGKIAWVDLTVENADQVRDFYQAVAGWSPQPVEMDGYADYTMLTGAGEAAAGVCHARGVNAAMPPQWMVYISVADLDESLAACQRLGGQVVVPIRGEAGSRFAVIQDPAGAVCALYEQRDQ